jgi:hypothetical protein
MKSSLVFITPLFYYTQSHLKNLWVSICEFSADEDSSYPSVLSAIPEYVYEFF